MIEITVPVSHCEIDKVRSLMREYVVSLNLDLHYQNFDDELEGLPGKYGPPSGCLLLAADDSAPVGCVAIRKLDGQTCEMKRLFVSPVYRGKGVGKQLVESIIEKAKKLGYTLIKLDTVEWMREAVSLYRSLRFVDAEAYTYNPSKDVIYLELQI